ncbi:MAG: DUF2202 domain-containing protein [Bacteroidota bacterium]|nr:DUF2202 domain-containing protein [Bacteroidota bacterium]
MKHLNQTLLAGVLSIFLLASCDAKTEGIDPELRSETEAIEASLAAIALIDQSIAANPTSTPCNPCKVNPTAPGEVTEADIANLFYMLDEEKLANNVYVYFNEKFNRRVFQNISKSEAVHQKAVVYLLNLFKIDVPEPKPAGEFYHGDLQELYTQLTSESKTLQDALLAGALIEEHDILDLQKAIDETENENIKRVFSNLKRASGFHLQAFVKNLRVQGINYKPQLLSQEEFDTIIGKS